MPAPTPTLVWADTRLPLCCGAAGWHACQGQPASPITWHRRLGSLEILIRRVEGPVARFQARIQDPRTSRAVLRAGAEFSEWEYPDLEQAIVSSEVHANTILDEQVTGPR